MTQKDRVYDIFKRYIDENNIKNSEYTRAYCDQIGVSFNYRYDLRNLKRDFKIPLSHIVVFCEFLTDSQRSKFFKELSSIDFFGGK
jgi:hypothetical protein